MIVSLQVDPSAVVTYHEDGKATDKAEKIEKIKQSKVYEDLEDDIVANGVLDPIVIRCEKNRVYVECGEKRVLIAREAGIEELNAIAYTANDSVEIPFDGQTALKDSTAIDSFFPRKQFAKEFSGVCGMCGHDEGTTTRTIKVPALQLMRDYVEAGIAKF